MPDYRLALSMSGDARAMMLFEANKKSMFVAYVLWLLFGTLGGHRFYSGRSVSAVAQLLLTIIGTLVAAIGSNLVLRLPDFVLLELPGLPGLVLLPLYFVLLVPLSIWILIDAFLIPRWIRNHNLLLAVQLINSGK